MPSCYGMYGTRWTSTPPRKSNIGRGFHPKKKRATR